jgi:hypothetical protein
MQPAVVCSSSAAASPITSTDNAAAERHGSHAMLIDLLAAMIFVAFGGLMAYFGTRHGAE